MKLKSIIVTVIVLLVLTASGIIAILEYKKENAMDNSVPTLSAPQNLTVDRYTISWDKVDNAVGYVVEINGESIETEYNFYFYLFTTGSEYQIRVKAVSDGEIYQDSKFSDYIFIGE